MGFFGYYAQKYPETYHLFADSASNGQVSHCESGTRTPKEKLIADLAHALEVSPNALDVPQVDSFMGLMHTLFALEDIYGLNINSISGELCLTLDKTKGAAYISMFDMFSTWHQEAEKLKAGQVTKEKYDTWRYNYPKDVAEQTKAALNTRKMEKDAEPTEKQ